MGRTRTVARWQAVSGICFLALALLAQTAYAQTALVSATQQPVVVQPVLIEAGSLPFHLKAEIIDRTDPQAKTAVELFWLGPEKYRRTIKSEDFSQTLIVNGSSVFEEDSDDYFPLDLQILITAMVDPRPVLDAFHPGDPLFTKANGKARESGQVCYSERMCIQSQQGLTEIVGSMGREMEFGNYRDFKGKSVARSLEHSAGPGRSGLEGMVTELSELRNVPEDLFRVEKNTPESRRNHTVLLTPEKLRNFATHAPEIIWPQTLDGAETGNAVFHVAIDPSGTVREVVPLRTANERANESAVSQIKAWKFKPILDHELPVEVETFLTLSMNTRAYGPPAPLSDKEARSLATNIVEPTIPAGTAPSGSTYTLRIAVDYEGRLIEVIGGEGEHKMNSYCYAALKQWQFRPIMENGLPRPYRAEISFKMP